MLRLCYEIKEPYNINIIKTKEVGEEIDFMYFYLRRIQGKHFKFVYEIRYDDMGKDKLGTVVKFRHYESIGRLSR